MRFRSVVRPIRVVLVALLLSSALVTLADDPAPFDPPSARIHPPIGLSAEPIDSAASLPIAFAIVQWFAAMYL